MGFAGRICRRAAAGTKGMTAWRPSFLENVLLATHLRPLDSQRITFADEIGLSNSPARRAIGLRIRTGEYDSATQSLSCRTAKLRRGNGHTVADFLGQLRFRAGEDRRQNGRILPEGAHFVQARAGDAKDWCG